LGPVPELLLTTGAKFGRIDGWDLLLSTELDPIGDCEFWILAV
jgi:hypothetical protein